MILAGIRSLAWSDAFARLEEFRRLDEAWDGEDAEAISSEALLAARDILVAICVAFRGALAPHNIVPLVDGGVQCEWFEEGGRLEIEITAGGELEGFAKRGGGKIWSIGHMKPRTAVRFIAKQYPTVPCDAESVAD